jgi:Eco29kI restriction endonuclease
MLVVFLPINFMAKGLTTRVFLLIAFLRGFCLSKTSPKCYINQKGLDMQKFDRHKHVYKSGEFEEIIKDTIRFFNGTPVHLLPPPERFCGTGVYAIYCISKSGIYKDFHKINRTSYNIPIYVGKAVPKGWRQSRMLATEENSSCELYNRIKEHSRSLELGKGVSLSDFHCRFMILEGKESDLIGTVEAALIRNYRSIWNSLIDGFGNHDPGSGRYEQAKSDWDICHPGRKWAEKCKGQSTNKKDLLVQIKKYMKMLCEEER